MSKTIRISMNTYATLERNTIGFESPSETIYRLATQSEVLEIYQLIFPVIQEKINILINEPNLSDQEALILFHYEKNNVTSAMELINKIFESSYSLTITELNKTSIKIKITRK